MVWNFFSILVKNLILRSFCLGNFRFGIFSINCSLFFISENKTLGCEDGPSEAFKSICHGFEIGSPWLWNGSSLAFISICHGSEIGLPWLWNGSVMAWEGCCWLEYCLFQRQEGPFSIPWRTHFKAMTDLLKNHQTAHLI